LDERYGVTPAPNGAFVVAANAAWLLMPFGMMWRMRRDHPFTWPAEAVA
jgi:hypothetical protein